MLEYDPRRQTIDLQYMHKIPLSEPDPVKDMEVIKNATEDVIDYNTDIQVILWSNDKPVGGTVWVDATPHSRHVPGSNQRKPEYFNGKYLTSFSYNLSFQDLIKNKSEYNRTHGMGFWNYLQPENIFVNGYMPQSTCSDIDRNDKDFWMFMLDALSRTPNFDLAYLNYNIPVFLVQGMHMMNPNIVPKPVLDGVLVCRNAQAKAVKAGLSPIEITYSFDRIYKNYYRSCFGSGMPYANIFPDHAFGAGDIVAFHNMCLKLDVAIKWLQENKLPFPFIIQLANPERILHYTKEEISEKVKQNLYANSGMQSEEELVKLYKKEIKRIDRINPDLNKKPLFKPSKRKCEQLAYCKPQQFWVSEIPTQAEAQYLYNQICIFNRGVTGQSNWR